MAKKIRLDVSETEDDGGQYGFSKREGENYEDLPLKNSAGENKNYAPPEVDPLACFAEWAVKADYMQKSPVNAEDASGSVPSARASRKCCFH